MTRPNPTLCPARIRLNPQSQTPIVVACEKSAGHLDEHLAANYRWTTTKDTK
ncbi:hypothetical protein MYK68_14130 [Gordonia sp. PP30]|uniref:hypothetical protein n=1 Tax=Gordonia sp. PP30 TaxID=2935861 RepID=UPI001FFEA040|nr:hypothetical protein [Gordonia sp. PP30]UQE73869.1 hypothetical protein MYK68_14130 [Gordonia sp. PP30]